MAKAAQHLAMTQPAVSKSISNLESALHVHLLDRNSRGIEPTAFAQVLLKRGNVVFDELAQGIRDIEYLADSRVGEVRVATGATIDAGLLPAVMDQICVITPDSGGSKYCQSN
jgi:DNA-binding transcriptional LysR family regulator